jgi:hypothetical protein
MPVRIRELIRRCLQKHADRRTSTLKDAAREIEACLASPWSWLGAAANSLSNLVARRS